MGANFAMNEKGLIATFDGGESELEEDTQFGFADFISALVYATFKCDTAAEAEKTISSLGIQVDGYISLQMRRRIFAYWN